MTVFFLLLVVYSLFAFKYRKQRVVFVLLILQVVSVVSCILIGLPSFSGEPKSWINAIVVLIFNLFLILPWRGYDKLSEIIVHNPDKVDKLVRLLLVFSFIGTIVLGVVAILVQTLITDINEFKYVEGESTYFYTHMLPFDARYFMLFVYTYYISYFMLFFHFYYLTRNNVRYSRLCFCGSFNIILYGLCMFSRWTITLYIGLFVLLFIIFYPMINVQMKRIERRFVYLLVGVAIIGFVGISINRFSDNKSYQDTIPSSSIVQNPIAYSFFDYLGQNNSAGLEVLNNYDGTKFCGILSLKELKNFFVAFRILPRTDNWEKKENTLRTKYFKEHAGGFVGWAAYIIYDFGYIGGFLLCLFLNKYIVNKKNIISLEKLLLSSFLLQIPICAIYYSQLSVVIVCIFYMFCLKLLYKLI